MHVIVAANTEPLPSGLFIRHRAEYMFKPAMDTSRQAARAARFKSLTSARPFSREAFFASFGLMTSPSSAGGSNNISWCGIALTLLAISA
jgi:hypothetical protein